MDNETIQILLDQIQRMNDRLLVLQTQYDNTVIYLDGISNEINTRIQKVATLQNTIDSIRNGQKENN